MSNSSEGLSGARGCYPSPFNLLRFSHKKDILITILAIAAIGAVIVGVLTLLTSTYPDFLSGLNSLGTPGGASFIAIGFIGLVSVFLSACCCKDKESPVQSALKYSAIPTEKEPKPAKKDVILQPTEIQQENVKTIITEKKSSFEAQLRGNPVNAFPDSISSVGQELDKQQIPKDVPELTRHSTSKEENDKKIGHTRIKAKPKETEKSIKASESQSENLSTYAHHPDAIVQRIKELPEFFGVEEVFLLFIGMNFEQKSMFLQRLKDRCSNSEAYEKSKSIVSFILNTWVTNNFVIYAEENIQFPQREIKAFQCQKEFLKGLSRWPEQIADSIFENFGAQDSLISHTIFISALFNEMITEDKEIFIKSSAHHLNQQKDAACFYSKYFGSETMQQIDWLCLIINYCREEVVKHFLEYYEKNVLLDAVNLGRQLILYVRYLDEHPEWVEQNSSVATSLFKQAVHGLIMEYELKTRLMTKHPGLFVPFSITCSGVTTVIPVCQLSTLSPLFERMITINMNESQQHKLELQEVTDVDAAVSLIHYLKTGEIREDEENVLTLFHYAQIYKMHYLSKACHNIIEKNLDKENFIEILESAIQNQWWDIRCLCLLFIKNNCKEQFIIDLVNKPNIDDGIERFLRYGVSVQKSVITCLRRYNCDLTRWVCIDSQQTIESLDELNQLILPTEWSTQNLELAIHHLLVALESNRSDFFTIFLNEAEHKSMQWDKRLKSAYQLPLLLAVKCHKIAHQYKKPYFAKVCLKCIINELNIDSVPALLKEAEEHQLPDLKNICLAFLSK